MAFSFNPGQVTTSGIPGQTGAADGTQPVTAAAAVANKSSPFYFIQERGGELSLWAYGQIILTVVAALSVFVGIVLYSYSVYLNVRITALKEELAQKEESFPAYNIDEMKKLSDKIAMFNKILASYVSPRSPLLFLEHIVENDVVFDKFSFEKTKELNKEGFYANFTVITGNYRSLIQQLEALNLTEYKKIAPKTEIGAPSGDIQTVFVRVSTPLVVEGKLPEEVESTFFGQPISPPDTKSQ